MSVKPLGHKNYGSIPHLPSSRMGPKDHACPPGMETMCTTKALQKNDVVYVTEKVDGSNVGIARIGDDILALGRSGYLAKSSRFEQHQLFSNWVREKEDFWREVLDPGQRIVGEWMAQAHSTRYSLPNGPFAAFDLLEGQIRRPFSELLSICHDYGIAMPKLIHFGDPISVEDAMLRHGHGNHGLLDKPEGVVYRIERKGEYLFLAKWVDPQKKDGIFLPEISGGEAVWNWRP